MAISLRSAIGSGELPLNPVQEDVYEGFSQATASPLQQGWHTASLGGAANSAYTKALMAKDAGDLEGFDANMAEAQALQQQAAGWAPEVRDYRQVNDLSSGLRYTAQGLGSAANSSLPSLVGGVAGGIGAAMIAARNPMMAAKTVGRLATAGGGVGAAIPGYDMEMEEAAGQAAQDEQIMATRSAGDILDAARVKGGINMLGEAVVPAMLMGKIGGTGLRQAFKSPTAALTALPGAIGQGLLTEGATEGAQNIVGQMTQNQLRGDPLGNIDYHETANDAIIGGMFGGGMGTVGGVADLAHRSMATIGQGAQDIAGSDALQNGIAKGFAKGKELAGQGIDIITELGKKGMAFAKEDAAQIKAAYNELGVEGAMVIAEDIWAKRTSDAARTVGDLATGAADVAKTKVGEHLSTLSAKLDNALGLNADEISDKLSENPFVKNNQMTDADFMKHVGGNGDSAVALATELRDSGLLDATPEASRMLLDSVLANPDSLKRDQAKQAQVAAIHHTMKNNIDLVDQLDEMVTNLSIYQDKSGKKFSKQSSPEITAARESLKEALASFGITDKQLVGRITASVGINGKNAALKQALVRELLGKGIDNKTVAAIGEAGFIDESAPQQTREEKRANESANREARRTAAANPFMTSDIEAYVNEAVKGTDQDSSLVKGGIVHAISSILTAAHSDMITEGEIDKFRTFIKNKLGERGDQLVESILNHDVLSGEGKAKKLGDSSREDRVMTKLAGLNSEGKLNSGRMKEAVRELANAHTDARVAEAVDKKKEYASAEVKAKEMMFSGVEGSSGKALRHLDRAKKARDADPWSKFNEIAGKYFNDPKEFGRLKALIGEYNGEARANAKHTSAGNPASVTPTEAMTGEDLDNYDVNQSTAENVDTTSDTAEIAAKEEQETGANKDNVVAEPTRFYGQTAKDPGKYNKYPGAPLTTHATYDHPSGEFDTMMKHVETKNVGSRMGSLNPIQWADEVAQHDGVKSDTLLDGAAKATIQHDAETKAKLQAMLASGKNLARRTPQGQQTHEQVEAAIIEQIKHIDLRKELLNSENGSGYGFFTNRMNRHFRYASTNAATGKMLMVDERMLDRFRVGNIATAADKYASKFGKEGSEEYAVRYDEFSNSIITLKDSDGSSFKFDIAGLVSSMVSRNQPADITGVGDSKATAMFFTDLKVALSNVITSLYTSDLLSKNDPFDTASGEQASLNKIGNSVKQKEFALKPSLVIYRNPKSSVTTEDGSHLEAGAQVYTYGQVFGMVGARAAKAVHKTAMATPLTVMELQSIMPGTTAAPKGATAAQKIVANKKREGTSLMVAKNVLEDVHGNKFNLQPSTLLRAMLERHGIPEDAIGVIGEDTNGMSNELAGALLSDGFALLKEAGFTLNADLSSAVLGPKVLWENSSFQTTVSQVNKTVNLPGAPKESQYRYTGSYDMVADRTTVALEKVTAATKALSKAQALRAEELADPIGYGRGTKARVTEAEINELKEKLEAANNDLLNSRNFGEADITHNETRKITRQTQGQVASDIKTKAPIYGTIDEKAEVERATDADQTDPDNRVNSGVHDRSTIRHAFLAQERAKHRAAKAQDIRAKRAAARSKVEPATISPVNIGPKDTSAGLSPEQRAAQRDSANKASEGKGGVAPMPATPAHVANPQPNLTNTKPATMQQTREVAAADASPKVAAHRAAAARALAAKRAEARRDRAAKAAEAVVEPVVEQEAEVETTRAKPVDNKVAFDIVNEKPMTVKELLTKDHWQDVSFERLVASLSYMAKMPALNLLRAIESVDPDYARELKNAVFPDDPNGGGTKFSKQTTKGEPGYMDRVQGYGTLRNGAVVALIGKFGPIANAAVGYDTIDGASRVFIYDADLLKQGLSASKTLVDRFTMQNSFKGDVSTAEISADGVENSTSGVFSKYKHLLSKVKGKDGLTYNKFKEGSFSNHEIRDVIRMLRDTANDAGLLENIKQIALYRATGANPSAPIRFVPKEQLMRFSKQSAQIHKDLGKSGFAATHDSPIRHEGKFNWRQHTGKGEGNASFGAGTYLSTADGVHRSYKNQFTAKISNSKEINRLLDEIDEVNATIDSLQESIYDGDNFRFSQNIARPGEPKEFTYQGFNNMDEARAYLKESREGYESRINDRKSQIGDKNHPNQDAVHSSIKYLQNQLDQLREESITSTKESLELEKSKAAALQSKYNAAQKKSPTYHVSVNANQEELLDWDSKFSDQSSEVQQALEQELSRTTNSKIRDALDLFINGMGKIKPNASSFYTTLSLHLGSQAEASEFLQELGIVGHVYNAAHGAEANFRNYVIYDDSRIETNHVSFSKERGRSKDTLHDNDSGLQADHERRLGSTVTMFLRDILPGGYAGQYSPKSKTAKGLIEVSRTAPNERGTLAHEDWHGVEDLLLEMGPEGQKIIDTIHKGVQDPRTVAWIKQQLIERGENPNDPDGAFSQLNDPSELAAFAFQFFVENDGKMTLPPRTRSLFEKIAAFVKKLAGIKEDIVKTENFFKFFDTGEFQKNMENPLSVVQSLQETTREKYLNQLNEVVKPVRALAFAAFGHTADRIKAINIPAYNEILKRMSEGSDGHAGYTEEQRARMYSFGNKYAAIVGGMEQKDLTPATKTKVQALIREIEQYKKDAGVKGWDLGRTSFPPVFELSKIEGKLAEFKQDLRAYGNMTGSEADLNNMVNQILYEGYAKGNDALFRDNPEKLAKWVSDDQTKHAFSYFKASTQAAEMARAFKGKSLEDLLEEGDAKATISDKQVIRTFVDASMGRAGMNMSPELRKLFGAVTTAINMSLLPFALFSQMVEPLQLAFRKNDVASAVNSAFRGMRDLPRTFNSVNAGVRKDIWENIALDLGMVSDAAAVSMISDVMNEVPLRGKMDKANAMFFRYIGMEQWSRSMHVSATQNALEFIKQHDKNPTENGNRLMEELGLKGKTIDYVNGIPDHNDPLVRAAVIHFVNESMAHPDPSTNTVWMNDPRFALLAHLKRFTFGFSYYINRRAMNDIKAGRYKELLPLAMFVPWKIATEGLKDMIKPGDEAYKANWTATDYIADSINKSGLIGRYGLGIDAGINMSHGGSGLEAVSPTAEMSGKLARAANEGHGWRTAIEQIPGGKLVTQ